MTKKKYAREPPIPKIGKPLELSSLTTASLQDQR